MHAERSCPVCKSTTAEPDDRLTRIVRAAAPERIVRCAGCGLVRRDPPLSPDRAAEIYNDAYYRQYEASVGMTGDLDGVLRPHLRKRLHRVERCLGVGRLLEIGCGKGAFLEHARQRGWAVRGVEVSAEAGNVAQDKGLDVHIGPVETVSPPAEPYDFVHMNHVLEHLAEPVEVLRRVFSWLRPGSRIVIEVPNEFDNLFFRFGSRVLPERAMIYPVQSTHEVFFNPTTLRRAVTAAGLAIERCRTVRWTIGDRSGIVGKSVRWAVYGLERPLGRAGNIEITAYRCS
jgi:2-polyprenyl-3-methyl-5-hydroxy-6-metoxy-1,4-benzoquinol methylase